MSKEVLQKLGVFNIESGEVIISDPCYDLDTWCMAKVENVKNGEWTAYILQSDEGDWGIRNSVLTAFHQDYSKTKGKYWSRVPASIGVDSGQAGIFDAANFKNDDIVTSTPKFSYSVEEDGDLWYAMCCDETLYTELNAGVITNGAVSSSGYGDGSYDAFTVKDKDGKIIGIKIEFLFEMDEEHEIDIKL